jgi:hypothetical protein
MASWRRAVLLGLVVWLVPFVVACTIFPWKTSWRSLFESIMPVTLAATVVVCTLRYFRKTGAASTPEAGRLGLLWLAICVAIDLPLMLSPPIGLSPAEYAADVGLTYVMIPVITVGMALAASSRCSSESGPLSPVRGGEG